MAERVWDRFLTERDRAHLAGSRHKPVGFGQRPALLLIDLYRWVFGDAPQPLVEAIKTWPGSCGPDAWSAIPHIQALLAGAREAGMPIVHVTGLDGCGVPGWSERRNGPPASDITPEAIDRRRRQFDIVDEVAPGPGEAFLRKSSPSAFFGTPLVPHLNKLGVDTIITCGESTSGCVRASVVDGCTYSFKMVVVEECVFDRHEAPHAINLFDMNQKYADVLPLADVLAWMRAWAAERDGQNGSSPLGRPAEKGELAQPMLREAVRPR